MERTDDEAEVPILWPPDMKNPLTGKDPDAGKDRKQKEITEGEVVGWHHQLHRDEFEQTLGDSERQGSLMCCSPWSYKEPNVTEQLKTTIVECKKICSLEASKISLPCLLFHLRSNNIALALKH